MFLVNNGRSSSDLDKVRLGHVNRNHMDELIRLYVLKYGAIGYKTRYLKRASRRALLL